MKLADRVRNGMVIWLALAVLATLPLRAEDMQTWSTRTLSLPPESARRVAPVFTALAIHPSGRWLAAAGDDHRVRIWDRETDRLVGTITGHTDWVRALAFCPDGQLLASAGNDRRVVLWSVPDGKRVRELQAPAGAIASLTFSPSGQFLAVAGFETPLKVYRTADATEAWSVSCPCQDMRALAFSADGQLIAGGGRNGRIRVWRADNGEVVDEYPAHRQRIRAIVFTGDGSQIISAGEDRVIFRAPVGAGAQGQIKAQAPAQIQSLALLADWLVTGGTDNTIRIWDGATGRELFTLPGHTGTVATLLALDGTLISGSYDTTVREWRLTSEIAAPR